ncbi:unnamed protein product [Musa hybrid cultivar]
MNAEAHRRCSRSPQQIFSYSTRSPIASRVLALDFLASHPCRISKGVAWRKKATGNWIGFRVPS